MDRSKYQLIGKYCKSLPNLVYLTVLKADGSYLGETVVSQSQFNDAKLMDCLIRDMIKMQNCGIEIALMVDPSTEKGGSNG